MSERLALILASLFMLLLIAGAAAWIYLQWHECRRIGFSVFYCIQHVM